MGMREWINENSAVVTIGAVVLLVVALAVVIMQSIGGGTGGISDQSWYMDTETGDFFAASNQKIPPIESPDGNEAVRVHFFSCGECNEGERFVGYLEKYTPQAKQVMDAAINGSKKLSGQEMDSIESGQLYKAPDGDNWYPAMTQGDQFQRMASSKCDQEGGEMQICLP